MNDDRKFHFTNATDFKSGGFDLRGAGTLLSLYLVKRNQRILRLAASIHSLTAPYSLTGQSSIPKSESGIVVIVKN